MSAVAPSLQYKPEARTETVEALVTRALRGLLRIPSFQRGLRWQGEDVIKLLDSVYRGFPIGSLLVWTRSVPAAQLRLGPLNVAAAASESAWMVVDGQQRLTALAASLGREDPLPTRPTDPFVVYFDPAAEQFRAPPNVGNVPPSWVPVAKLLDSASLSEWVHEWEYGKDAKMRKAVFEAGRRLREYPVPLYVVDTGDEGALREIFYRVNNTGRRLTWTEVHDAIHGHNQGGALTLGQVADDLESLGMGRPEEENLLRCVLAFAGLDVTRTLAWHRERRPEVLEGAATLAMPVVRDVMTFLQQEVEVTHLRLVPRWLPLVVLTRFFRSHPHPMPRTRTLLVRWVWRLFLTLGTYDERALIRQGVAGIDNDEEASVQRLLRMAPKPRRATFSMPPAFDARAAASRIAMVALAHMRPRHLSTGDPLDVPSLLDAHDARAFRVVVDGRAGIGAVARGPANRMIHPEQPRSRSTVLRQLARQPYAGDVAATLDSHGIDKHAADALSKGHYRQFLEKRAKNIARAVEALGERLAAWRHNDRPTIAHVISRRSRQ